MFYSRTLFVSSTMFVVTTDMPEAPWKRRRRPAAIRQQLSRDVIVDAAMRILDAEGLEGMSMRRVADELNTGAASLYAHVANKEELLDLLLDRVIAEVEVPVPDPTRWQDQLREVGSALHRAYSAHRDIARVSLANIPTGQHALRISDGLMAIMLAGRVPPRVAGWTLDRLALYIAADSYEDSMFFYRLADSGMTEEEFMRHYVGGIREFYAKLPADRFPHLTANLEAIMGGDGTRRFDFGLDMMIRSLATYTSEDLPG
jgi:AcrR family transcriptional regulator